MLLKVREEFTEWIADEDWLHAREMARFYIDVDDRPDLARRLALINLDLQREPEDERLERRTRPASSSKPPRFSDQKPTYSYEQSVYGLDVRDP